MASKSRPEEESTDSMASECVSEEEEAIVVFSMAAKSMLPYDDATSLIMVADDDATVVCSIASRSKSDLNGTFDLIAGTSPDLVISMVLSPPDDNLVLPVPTSTPPPPPLRSDGRTPFLPPSKPTPPFCVPGLFVVGVTVSALLGLVMYECVFCGGRCCCCCCAAVPSDACTGGGIMASVLWSGVSELISTLPSGSLSITASSPRSMWSKMRGRSSLRGTTDCLPSFFLASVAAPLLCFCRCLPSYSSIFFFFVRCALSSSLFSNASCRSSSSCCFSAWSMTSWSNMIG
mmetsp:Transcript_25450/g.34983  ORF Transcript_25450/g.34983 Transcript_25450/m.34983 type:complete len:289 (-) Transcript_25450:121-987(-)